MAVMVLLLVSRVGCADVDVWCEMCVLYDWCARECERSVRVVWWECCGVVP